MRELPEGISGATWTDIAVDYLWSARHFSDLAQEQEQPGNVGRHTEEYRRHRSYVVAAVFSSVAYLETAINEIFAGCADSGVSWKLRESSPDHRRILASLWCEEIRRLPTLRKYQLALRAGSLAEFHEGQVPYSDAALLVRLRNALVHYEPDWVNTDRIDGSRLTQAEMHRWERALRSKFEPNALAGQKYPFWPERCLGAGCARWGAQSAEQFLGAFRERMNPIARAR
jgi:hypothetical protein